MKKSAKQQRIETGIVRGFIAQRIAEREIALCEEHVGREQSALYAAQDEILAIKKRLRAAKKSHRKWTQRYDGWEKKMQRLYEAAETDTEIGDWLTFLDRIDREANELTRQLYFAMNGSGFR